MKLRTFLLIILVCLGILGSPELHAWQKGVTVGVSSNILQRTFRIRYEGNKGTCFTVDVQGKRYLITAKHLVASVQGNAVVEIYRYRKWLPLRVRLVKHAPKGIDMTVLAPQELFGESHPLELTGEFTVSEDVYFLGFPYGLSTELREDMNSGFPVPFVKKAIMSGFGKELIFLDGHNNPEFSGGPIVRPFIKGKGQAVIGIVAGYLEETVDKYGNKLPDGYRPNTGIISAYRIKHAIDIIKAKSIGFPLPSEASVSP